jgi:hypothetical protein
MSEVWAKVKLEMPEASSYKIIEVITKQIFDFDNHWPVEKYDPDNYCIDFKEVTANYNDVTGFGEVLKEKIYEFAVVYGESRGEEYVEALRRIPFTMYGTIRYLNTGETVKCVIKKEDENLSIEKLD